MKEKSNPNYQTRAISRAIEVLRAFSVDSSDLSLTEISDLTKLSKSTLIRILNILIDERLIEQNVYNDKYHLGITSFEIGMIYYLTQLHVNIVSKQYITKLSEKLNLTINIAILDKNQIVYVDIQEPNKIMRVNFSIGSRFEVHCTALGKVLLSQFSEDKLDQIIEAIALEPKTKYTITSPEEFKKATREARANGYAEDVEESLLGLRCVAVPIYDYSRRIVAAMSASGTIYEVNEESIPTIINDLKETAKIISGKLGYQD